MYKKYASKCIIVGMIFIFLTGCVSITESSPAEKGSKDFVRMEAENVLDVCIEQMQSDRVLLRTKTICQFYKAIEREELSEEEREAFCERLLEDNILRDGEFRMTACEISDLDQNGQKDMIVMAVESEDLLIDAPGCIYIYYNDDPPYCFNDMDDHNRKISSYSLGFWDECQAGDIDNDGNLELIISIYDGGNGGAGGREHIILRRKEGTFEEVDLSESMDLSEDINEKYRWGLRVSVEIGDRENLYKAYCPYLDDTIEFSSENAFPFESQYAEQHGGGGNCRGFYNYRCVEYKGKNALQCMEYLYGEGGIAHAVGIAMFTIVWDEEGKCDIAEWWIETW